MEEYETDKGTKIEVVDTSKQPPPTEEDKKEEDGWEEWMRKKGVTIERTGEMSPYYDCHGWMFTCGEKWIDGYIPLDEEYDEQIKKILKQNGYKKSDENRPPSVGDLVIYKVSWEHPKTGKMCERINHSGIVTKVRDDKVIEVESKWGGYGRYKHAPKDTPFGTPQYYY